jgi:hypothetical protein
MEFHICDNEYGYQGQESALQYSHIEESYGSQVSM